MSHPYSITPVDVPHVQTPHRTIHSPIPHPESVRVLEDLRRLEPVCMEGQPPIVWDRAQGATVCVAYGNRWIDLSSGVVVTNAGHGRQEMVDAIVAQAQSHLLTSYCFPNVPRQSNSSTPRIFPPSAKAAPTCPSTAGKALT